MKNRIRRLICVFAVIALTAVLFAAAAASSFEAEEVTSKAVGDQTEQIPEWATRPAQERPELTEEDLYYMTLRIDEP